LSKSGALIVELTGNMLNLKTRDSFHVILQENLNS